MLPISQDERLIEHPKVSTGWVPKQPIERRVLSRDV